jgi:hypothetical protein
MARILTLTSALRKAKHPLDLELTGLCLLLAVVMIGSTLN